MMIGTAQLKGPGAEYYFEYAVADQLQKRLDAAAMEDIDILVCPGPFPVAHPDSHPPWRVGQFAR